MIYKGSPPRRLYATVCRSRHGPVLYYYHSGGIAGTSSYWMRIYGYTFAILINTRLQANNYYTAIDWLCYDITANLNITGAMKGDQFDVLF